MDLSAKLASLGLTLPPAPKPVAVYVPAVRTGNLVFVSGQIPVRDGKVLFTGTVPSGVPMAQAQQAAQQCALNALAVVGDQIGGNWSRLVRIVRLCVFVASDNGFGEQPQVANGASELLEKVFGDAGKHSRSAVGVNTLPRNVPVELEMVAEVR